MMFPSEANGYKRKGFETQKRSCMKCRKEFKSISSGNRICSRCNSHNAAAPKLVQYIHITTPARKGKDIR